MRETSSGNHRTRILFADHTAQPSGAQLAMMRLIEDLRADFDVIVLLGEEGDLAERLRSKRIPVYVVPLPGEGMGRNASLASIMTALWRSVEYIYDLRFAIKRLKPDLVHINSLRMFPLMGLAAKSYGAVVVWHGRDRIARDYLSLPVYLLVRCLALILPDGYIANSEATARTCPTRGQRATIASPIDYESLSGILRQTVKGSDSLTIGTFSRLAPWKGQDLFLRAFALAFPDGDAEALIVGGALFGEERYALDLEALAASLGLGSRVRFIGHVDDLIPFYSITDVAVLSSKIPEPFGQVVAEAMAAGIPVVVPSEGGPREYVRDGETGLYYSLSSELDLARAMLELSKNAALRAQLGEAAREAAQRFSPEEIGRQVRSFYETLWCARD
jgi:glycosyltransferase involved in cell wall biosynthesis